MTKYVSALALIFMLAACGGGDNNSGGSGSCGCSDEDVPKDFRVSLKFSGDSISNFKVTHLKTSKPDFSSPRSLIEDIAKFMDKKAGIQSEGDKVDSRFEEIIDAQVLSAEKLLLVKEIASSLAAEREENAKRSEDGDKGKPETKHSALEVTNEVKNDDGTVSFEVIQKTESAHKEPVADKDGQKWVMSTRTSKERYTAKKIKDGTWRIAKHERWNQTDREDETKGEWEEQFILVQVKEMIHYKRRLKLISPLDNSTAEKTASAVVDSLFGLDGFKFMGGIVYAMVAVEPLIEQFFTPELLKKMDKLLKEELKEQDNWTGKPREFESVISADGVTTIVFKLKDPENKYNKDKLVLKFKKFDDGWKVVEGGSMVIPWNAEEGAKAEYKKADKFSTLKWK